MNETFEQKRYDWWSYVKGMIRRYPLMDSGNIKSEIGFREYRAVQNAISKTLSKADGAERIDLIGKVFWDKTHTLSGAAMLIPCSYATARRWHTDFVKCVAREYGFLEQQERED